jgi:hypothetical protein
VCGWTGRIDAGSLSRVTSAAQVAGPGLGGALVQAVTAPVAIVLDALSYPASAVLLGRTSSPEPRRHVEGAARTATFTAIRQGLSQVWRNPLLRASGPYTWLRPRSAWFLAATGPGALLGAAAPIGALGGGRAGQWLGVRTALLIAGIGTTAACAWLLCSPIRRLAALP